MHLMAAVFYTTVTKLILFFDQITKGYENIKVDEMGFNNTVSFVFFFLKYLKLKFWQANEIPLDKYKLMWTGMDPSPGTCD